ncbi:MAG: MFS transporter [Acetobacteraceae bacterium]|nr:MFS transporter [Acetobacteraceae bacterium]
MLLDQRGTAVTVTGLNASVAFIGVMLGPMLTPTLIRRFGFRRFLAAAMLADILDFLAMKPLHSLSAWFVLRLFSGLIGSGIFTAGEAWINLLVDDATRGRVIGIYAAALSAGLGLGPLVLTITGISGWPPFLANAGLIVLGMLPLLAANEAPGGPGRERSANPLVYMRRAALIVSVVALFGLLESANFSLLPIWGVRSGLTVSEASALVSTIYLGGAVLQVPIGVLSDKIRRINALRFCALVGVTGSALLLARHIPLAALYPLLLVWGGIMSGIYPIALGVAGDRFAGAEMVQRRHNHGLRPRRSGRTRPCRRRHAGLEPAGLAGHAGRTVRRPALHDRYLEGALAEFERDIEAAVG